MYFENTPSYECVMASFGEMTLWYPAGFHVFVRADEKVHLFLDDEFHKWSQNNPRLSDRIKCPILVHDEGTGIHYVSTLYLMNIFKQVETDEHRVKVCRRVTSNAITIGFLLVTFKPHVEKKSRMLSTSIYNNNTKPRNKVQSEEK